MKKKKGVGRNISKNKNLFNDKRLLAVVIATFLVFAFALSFVHVGEVSVTGYAERDNIVPDPALAGVGDKVSSFISNMFADWSSGNMDINISKYLFWIMLSILIYSILTSASFPEKPFLRWLLAIPISFLSIAFITPDDLFGIMTSYTALGLTLTIVLPFMVMFYFNTMLLTDNKLTVGKILFQRFLWILFSAFLIYRMIILFSTEGMKLSGAVVAITIGAFAISALITLFNSKYMKLVFKLRKVSKVETQRRRELEAVLEASQRKIDEQAKAFSGDSTDFMEGSNIGYKKTL